MWIVRLILFPFKHYFKKYFLIISLQSVISCFADNIDFIDTLLGELYTEKDILRIINEKSTNYNNRAVQTKYTDNKRKRHRAIVESSIIENPFISSKPIEDIKDIIIKKTSTKHFASPLYASNIDKKRVIYVARNKSSVESEGKFIQLIKQRSESKATPPNRNKEGSSDPLYV